MCATYEVAKVIGIQNTIKLQSELQGWLYIAERPGPRNKIAQVIGSTKARLLGKHLGAERVWIGKGYLKADRNSQICDLHAQGASTKDIGKLFSMTPRNVRNIVN